MAITATQVTNPYLLRDYKELAETEKTQSRFVTLAAAVTLVAIVVLFIAVTALALSGVVTPFIGAAALVMSGTIVKFLHARVYTRLCGLAAHHAARHLEYTKIANRVSTVAEANLLAYAGCLGSFATSLGSEYDTGIGTFLYHVESYESWKKKHKDLSDFLLILRRQLRSGVRYDEVMDAFTEKYELKGQNEFVDILERMKEVQVLRDDQRDRIKAEIYLIEGQIYDIEEAYLLRHKVMAAYTVYVLRHAHEAKLPISEEAFTFHPDGVRARMYGDRRRGDYFPGISREEALPPYPLGTVTEIAHLLSLIEKRHTRLAPL
jgi:hypothetical protein